MKVGFYAEHKDTRDKVTLSVHIVSYEDGLSELIQTFRNFLLAVGYQPGSIDKYIEAE